MKINYNPITNKINDPVVVPLLWREPVKSLDDLDQVSLPVDGECRYVEVLNKVYQYWKEDNKWHNLGTPASGEGDMQKSVYDTNNNGIVDNSERLEGYKSSYFMEKKYVSEYKSFEVTV